MNLPFIPVFLLSCLLFSHVLTEDPCVPLSSGPGNGGLNLNPFFLSCDAIRYTHVNTAGKPLAAFLLSGNLGDVVCSVYGGHDNTAPLLGTLTGDGVSSGVLKPSSDVVSFYCVGPGGEEISEPVISTYAVLEESIKLNLSPPEASPLEITSAGYPNDNYPSEYFLEYTFSSTYPCSYSFKFTEYIGDSLADSIYILWDKGGYRITQNFAESLQFTEAIGLEVKFQFVSNSRTTFKGFQVFVSAECEGNPQLPTKIQCDETILISLNSTQLPEFDLQEGENLIIAPNPVASLENVHEKCIASQDSPTWHFNLTDCNPVTVIENGTLCLEFTVRRGREVAGIITREKEVCAVFKCVYDAHQIVSFKIRPDNFKVRVEGDEEMDSLDLRLNFYEDDTFQTLLPEDYPAVAINNYVYVEASFNSGFLDTNFLVLRAMRCWATRSDDPDEENFYSIIDDGCAADNAYDPLNAIEVFNNYDNITAAFRFLAFAWNNVTDDDQAICVHCELELCDSSVDPTCTTRVCNRRRRSISSGYKYRHLVSTGPIRLIPENKETCLINDGGCSHFCTMVGGSVVCLCPSGHVLDKDDKTCATFEEHRSDKEEVPMFVTNEVIIGAFIVLFLAVSACLYNFSPKKGGKKDLSSA